MEEKQPYRFNIINCEKLNSQFNFGMQPVLYSEREAMEGRAGWVRTATNITYYKNHFYGLRKNDSVRKSDGHRYCYTLTFTVVFPHANDACYLAYHYPYSYSSMMVIPLTKQCDE